MSQDDELTTVLNLITEALGEHNQILVNHQKHLVRLSTEVAVISNTVKDLKAAGSLDSNNAEFFASMNTRLAAISSAIKQAKS
jgi:hypothetical protein